MLVHVGRRTDPALSEAPAAGSFQRRASVSWASGEGGELGGQRTVGCRRTRLAGPSSSHAGPGPRSAPRARWPVHAAPTAAPTAGPVAPQRFSPSRACAGRSTTCTLVSPQARGAAGVARTVSQQPCSACQARVSRPRGPWGAAPTRGAMEGRRLSPVVLSIPRPSSSSPGPGSSRLSPPAPPSRWPRTGRQSVRLGLAQPSPPAPVPGRSPREPRPSLTGGLSCPAAPAGPVQGPHC